MRDDHGTVATDISEKSSSVARRTAEITPAVNPNVKAKASASTPNVADLGNPDAMTSLTVDSTQALGIGSTARTRSSATFFRSRLA